MADERAADAADDRWRRSWRAVRRLGPALERARALLLIPLLAVFLLAIDLLGSGLGLLGEDQVDALFRGLDNPLVGLLVGVLATVLAQSSSVTTATVVGLVGSGALDLTLAVPVIMGANIGTTVTSTLASVGSIRRSEEFRRAFAGATVHDAFNICAAAVLLPVELLTGALSRAAVALSVPLADAAGEFRSPARGPLELVSGPITGAVEAWLGDGLAAALVLILAGLGGIFATLFALTRNMRAVMAGPAERGLNTVLARAGVVGMLVGAVLTLAVQSSSITTSLLVPMIAAGVLSLPAAYPVTLGANLGTTVTALLAALAVPAIAGLQIALLHLVFNTLGIALFYGVRPLRQVPLRTATALGTYAASHRPHVVAGMVIVFYLVPLAGILLLR